MTGLKGGGKTMGTTFEVLVAVLFEALPATVEKPVGAMTGTWENIGRDLIGTVG